MKRFFFGIDGGGTHSRIAIVNEAGETLARFEAGSANIYSVTQEQVKENLNTLITEALSSGGIQKSEIAAGCLGSAGLGRYDEKKLYKEFFDGIFEEEIPITLCSDGEILLAGGLGGLEGYCLIAGTGSIALSRNVQGAVVRAGGHGYLLGDEGSASWIGRSAAARVLRSLELRDLETTLLENILKAARLEHSDSLVRYIQHEADKAAVARLAPLVTEAARRGDPLALDILQKGAAELALLVQSVVQRSKGLQRQALVLAGGVLEHDEILGGFLKKLLKEKLPAISIEEKKGSALDGAVLLARNMTRSGV